MIAEGEVLQLMNVNDPDITEENYMRVIYSKTARLFEAAAQCSGILAGCTAAQEKGLQDYGRYLGTAFQLIDDLLDYSADGETLGKTSAMTSTKVNRPCRCSMPCTTDPLTGRK